MSSSGLCRHVACRVVKSAEDYVQYRVAGEPELAGRFKLRLPVFQRAVNSLLLPSSIPLSPFSPPPSLLCSTSTTAMLTSRGVQRISRRALNAKKTQAFFSTAAPAAARAALPRFSQQQQRPAVPRFSSPSTSAGPLIFCTDASQSILIVFASAHLCD